MKKNKVDLVASFIGSWAFIIFQASFVIISILLAFITQQPTIFILLTLFVSLVCSFAVPVLQMSENKKAATEQKEFALLYYQNKQQSALLHVIHKDLHGQCECHKGVII